MPNTNPYAQNTFSEWKPYQKFVQSGMVDGKFINAGFTILCAGPPRLGMMGTSVSGLGSMDVNAAMDQLVLPIGVVQNVNLSHNRTFNRIFEVGSERSYFISGRTMGQLALARVLYHGPSLLRMMYAYYSDTVSATSGVTVPELFGNAAIMSMANPHDVIIPPGYENFYVNLASDLFNQPIGLMLYIKDSNQDSYGAVYLEGCYIPNHTLATDAQGVIMQESAAVQFERAVPVSVSPAITIAGSADYSTSIV